IVAHPDHREAILVGEAEGPQHHGVDDRVDGRDRADGRREQADGRRGHAACVAKRAEALLEQVADHARSRGLAGEGYHAGPRRGLSPLSVSVRGDRPPYGATESGRGGNANVPAASATTWT